MAEPDVVAGPGVESGDRFEELRRAVAAIRTRVTGEGMERRLLVVGGVMLPVGLSLILLGWYGASHTPYVFEQVPYIISGGILGLGVAVVGGFLYFGYWIAQLVREQRAQTERLEQALARMEELAGEMASDGDAVAPRSRRRTG